MNLRCWTILLKPISFERFILAVDKAYEKKANQGEKTAKEQAIISNPKEEFLFVKTGSKLQKIDFDEIIYIEGMSEYLKIVTGAENVMTLQNFAKMGSALPPENFVRVHKSYMVSINKIESIERNRIYIHDHIIPISDTYKEAFFKLLSSKKVL
jgi:two-component system LytT family response regulator